MARRVGLLTLPLHTNYGGILQAVALYSILSDLGWDVVLLERDRPRRYKELKLAISQLMPASFLAGEAHGQVSGSGVLSRLRRFAAVVQMERQRTAHRPFIEAAIPSRSGPLLSREALDEAVARLGLNAVVVGSDQVWRPDYQPPGSEEEYFLGFVNAPAVRRISYAASFGVGKWAFPERIGRVSELLGRFDAVSVREASGVSICAEVFGRRDAEHVLDPTLLVSPSFYDGLAPPRGERSGKSVLQYVLDRDPHIARIGQTVADRLGGGYAVNSLLLDVGDNPPDVPAWLRAFKDADFVVTDSFHGTVFSIIFRKNFLAIANYGRGAERFISLLSQLGLGDRLIMAPTDPRLPELAARPIDFDAVDQVLAGLRRHSMDFLARALQ